MNENTKKWIYERGFVKSEFLIVDLFRRCLRTVILLTLLPKILITENKFRFETIVGRPGMRKCLVFSRTDRILRIFKNTLKGFHVSNMCIDQKICAPNFSRLIRIFYQSIKNDCLIGRMAEIYDINNNKVLADDFDCFAASDGVSLISRNMCNIFNILKKDTYRIVPHADGPKLDRNYTYNFLTDNIIKEVPSGWIKISGSPWTGKHSEPKKNNFIGIIGEPAGVRLVGIEYWMLILACKLKKDGFIVKVRLHPQAYALSNYIIKNLFQFQTSEDENEFEFISSCRCLISSYRSTILDLAISAGIRVLLDKQHSKLKVGKNFKEVSMVELKNNYDQVKNLVSQTDTNPPLKKRNLREVPSIKDVVS